MEADDRMKDVDLRFNYYALLTAIIDEDMTVNEALRSQNLKTADKTKHDWNQWDTAEIEEKLIEYIDNGGELVSTKINNHEKLPQYDTVKEHLGDIDTLRREYQ